MILSLCLSQKSRKQLQNQITELNNMNGKYI